MLGVCDLSAMKKLLAAGGDDDTNRFQISAVNQAACTRVACSEELVLASGSHWTWHFADPSLLLPELVARHGQMADTMGRIANQ